VTLIFHHYLIIPDKTLIESSSNARFLHNDKTWLTDINDQK